MDRMVGGIIRFIVGLFSSFFFLFLPFPLIHTTLRLAMAMATTSKSLLFFFLFSFLVFLLFTIFVAFSSNPFFLLLQRTPDTKLLRPMAAPSAGAVL